MSDSVNGFQHHVLDFIKNMDPNGPGFVKALVQQAPEQAESKELPPDLQPDTPAT